MKEELTRMKEHGDFKERDNSQPHEEKARSGVQRRFGILSYA
jgi:hypothetical protein